MVSRAPIVFLITVGRVYRNITGSHPWLTILLLPGFWACNIVLSQENSIGFSRLYSGFTRNYYVLVGCYQDSTSFFLQFSLGFNSNQSHGGTTPLYRNMFKRCKQVGRNSESWSMRCQEGRMKARSLPHLFQSLRTVKSTEKHQLSINMHAGAETL